MANVMHKENLGVVINMLSHLYKDGMNFSVMHTLHIEQINGVFRVHLHLNILIIQELNLIM